MKEFIKDLVNKNIVKWSEEYYNHEKYYNPDYLKLFENKPIHVIISKKGDDNMACGKGKKKK